jgi:hypothetical protein
MGEDVKEDYQVDRVSVYDIQEDEIWPEGLDLPVPDPGRNLPLRMYSSD